MFFFILVCNVTAFITVLYRKKINNKLCEQKFDMDIQKFNEEQEKSVVGIITNFIINLE